MVMMGEDEDDLDRSSHLFGSYRMVDSVPRALHITQPGRQFQQSHFTDKETEAQTLGNRLGFDLR